MNDDFYIGHSTYNDLRFKASSGGIGTTIIKYLLNSEKYGTAVTFRFNQEKCLYEPYLIYSFKDFNNCGSIYQDTDTIGFIKENIKNIKNGIVITCMPCQVRAIQNILSRENIPNFIISFCCSGQTTIGGTWFYYKLLHINKNDIINMQYRGNGWPSGIQIKLKNGTIIKKENYTYPWTLMYQSKLFKPKRCFKCNKDISYISDISLADPWLKEYIDQDKIGNTLFVINTQKGKEIISNMVTCSYIKIKKSSYSEYLTANGHTIKAKQNKKTFDKYTDFLTNLSTNKWYKSFFTQNLTTIKLHFIIIKIFHKIYKQ